MEICPGEDLLALDKHLQTKHWYQTLQPGSFLAFIFQCTYKRCKFRTVPIPPFNEISSLTLLLASDIWFSSCSKRQPSFLDNIRNIITCIQWSNRKEHISLVRFSQTDVRMPYFVAKLAKKIMNLVHTLGHTTKILLGSLLLTTLGEMGF